MACPSTLHMSLSIRHGKPLIPQGPRFRSRLSRRLATGMESAKTSRGEGTAQDPRAKSLIRLASQAATYRTGPRTRRAKSSSCLRGFLSRLPDGTNHEHWQRGAEAMARNAVQFQKGLSEAVFDDLYGTEEKCRAAVRQWRWPKGFECPVCGGTSHSWVKTRGLFQCTACRRQTSLIAGTIFAATKVPLRTWFRAMYHLTQGKQGLSSIELGRRLGVTQTTAWTIKHKLAQVMMERDAEKRLSGRVELDDAYLGGERSGGKRGRGAPGKTPFVAAVETTPDRKPMRLKLRRVTSFCGQAISGFAKR